MCNTPVLLHQMKRKKFSKIICMEQKCKKKEKEKENGPRKMKIKLWKQIYAEGDIVIQPASPPQTTRLNGSGSHVDNQSPAQPKISTSTGPTTPRTPPAVFPARLSLFTVNPRVGSPAGRESHHPAQTGRFSVDRAPPLDRILLPISDLARRQPLPNVRRRKLR